MKLLPQNNRALWLGLGLGAIVFIAAAQLSQQYSELLRDLTTEMGIVGVLSYIGILIVSIVVAPVASGFLVPVAANSFGPLLAALYSIIGWTIGSVIAFWLARYVQRTALQDVTFITRIQQYEAQVPRWYLYGLITVLRMTLPVDVLSYALGIASSIGLRAFLLTTIIGITPLTFVFTYAAGEALWIQIGVAMLGGSLFLAGVYFVRRKFF